MFSLRSIQNAIELIGLNDSDAQDSFGTAVKRKYYERALELHPDKNGSTEQFQELQAAYELISRAVRENEALIRRILTSKTIDRVFTSTKPGNTQDYILYKQALKDYAEAIEQYYEKVKQVNLNREDPEYQRLCGKIQQVKKDLFEVIKIDPAGIWVSDCIEKISRINVWLKNDMPSTP